LNTSYTNPVSYKNKKDCSLSYLNNCLTEVMTIKADNIAIVAKVNALIKPK